MKAILPAVFLVGLSWTLAAQSLVITNPTAGAQVPVGSGCSIGWAATNLTGQTLKIELSMPGISPNRSIARLVPVEAGHYEWDIPWEVLTTNGCQFVVTSWEGTNPMETARGPEFSVVSNPAPALLFRAPAGGELWPSGARRSVAWETHNLAGNLTLDLLRGEAVVDSIAGLSVVSNRCYTLPAGLAASSNYFVRLTSAAVPSLRATSPAFQVTERLPTVRPWTILFYIDADCFNMESSAMESVRSLGQLNGTTNANYLVQLDRSPAFAATYGSWFDTKRFVVKPGMLPTPEQAAQNPGELNMSSPDTLVNFINWGVENYPATNYFLILADHGWGWADGLITDESNGNKQMSTREFEQALLAAEVPMTIVGLDMCVEGQIEIAHQLRNTGAQLLLASQYKETRDWPYLTVFQQLESRLATLTPEALAVLFCDGFIQLHKDPLDNGTLAATRLNKVEALTAAIANLADEMVTNSTDRAAVRRKAAATKTAFHQAVLYSANTPTLQWQINGLDINFPTDPNDTEFSQYNRPVIDFPPDSHWRTFLIAYFDRLTNSWIADARTLVARGTASEVDVLRLLQALQPEDTNVWLNVVTDGDGTTRPGGAGNFQFARGEIITLAGIGDIRQGGMGPPITNHFVRWYTSSGIEMANDRRQATNTFTVQGDGVIMASFSQDQETYQVAFTTEGNGSFSGTNHFTVQLAAGANGPTVTATADPGYVFAGWGGDYPDTANPLTVTNVQSDMTVIAYFWPTRPTLSIERAAGKLTLSWPAWPPGYVLESAGDLIRGGWTAVADVATNRIVLPLTTTNQFFRLSQDIDAWHSPYSSPSP